MEMDTIALMTHSISDDKLIYHLKEIRPDKQKVYHQTYSL
jgi:hypothetical protein